MKDSQNAAIYNAYKRANRTVSFENKGVLVAGVAKGMPSEGKLKLGDVIIAVDGKTFEKTEQFIEYMTGKKEGDTVNIEYKRDGKQLKRKFKCKDYSEWKWTCWYRCFYRYGKRISGRSESEN